MINDQQAAKDVIEYVLSDEKEHDDYLNQCLENGVDPFDLKNSNHVYAKCLRAIGDPLDMTQQERERFDTAGIPLDS